MYDDSEDILDDVGAVSLQFGEQCKGIVSKTT